MAPMEEWEELWGSAESDAATETINRDRHFYGASAWYLGCKSKEVLCEGGARTAKSFTLMAKTDWTCREYPGSRHLFLRSTRKALSTTILPDWESLILWEGHPAIHGKARPHNRVDYLYPNGSVVDVLGLDDEGAVQKVLSGQWDRINYFQAEDCALRAWLKLLTRLSCNNTPYRQATADVNPANQFHWLNKRADTSMCMNLSCGTEASIHDTSCSECGGSLRPLMRRISFIHEDNPLLYDHEKGEWTEFGREYILDTLGHLSGVDRDRLLFHRWIAESGLVLNAWDSTEHLISGHLSKNKDIRGGWWLTVFGWDEPVLLEWFGAGLDWGYSKDPGALTVWGYDREGNRYLVAQVKRLGMQLDWWAARVLEFIEEFDLRYVAADPSRKDLIDAMNLWLGPRGQREGLPLVISANNSLTKKLGPGQDITGIDLMRWGLKSQVDGQVRTRILRDSLRHGADRKLLKDSKPTCVEQEVLAWTMVPDADGKPTKDRPDENCADDLLDTWRYEQAEGWGKRLFAHQENLWTPGSFGDVLKHKPPPWQSGA